MAWLYVLSHGAAVRKRGESLIVEIDGERADELEARRIDGAVILSTVSVSPAALELMLEHGADVAILSPHGKLVGKVVPPLGKNSLLRKAQYERESDPAFAERCARAVLLAKIENQRQVVLRWRKDNPDITGLAETAAEMERCAASLSAAPSAPAMLGLEGSAARAYFSAFAKALRAEGVSFSGRAKHPPPDPVNAALSFGYVLLDSILHGALEAAGFDPFIGFLHEEYYGRPSLALDLLEPFRAPVVDRFVVRLFNLGMLGPDDFRREPPHGVRMTRDALRVFFREWEKTLHRMEVREAVRACVENLRAVYLEGAELVPWRWSAR